MAESKTTQTTKEAEVTKEVTLRDVYQQMADKSKSNKAEGKENEKVSLTDKVKVKFTKDFKHITKGHIQEVSAVAYEMYNQNKVVEKVS